MSVIDKKTLTLGELSGLIDKDDLITRRFSLIFNGDGESEDDSNEVWLIGEIMIAFKDWIVTKIGFRYGKFRIFIKRPLKEASNHAGQRGEAVSDK